jgi:hypothetical protein
METQTIIQVPLKAVLDQRLDIDHFILLSLFRAKDYDNVKEFVQQYYPFEEQYLQILQVLQRSGWLKITGDNHYRDVEIRERFNALVLTPADDVEDWIQSYRKMFEQVGRNGIMGDSVGVRKKMKKFVLAHHYTKEQILAATARYIESQGPSYQFLQQADYFISKTGTDGVATSRLLSTLEEMESTSSAPPGVGFNTLMQTGNGSL